MKEDLGATGKFPHGKINNNDEGEIQFSLAVDHEAQTVLLDFGKPVLWLGLPRKEAIELGTLLIKSAQELK